MSLVSGNELEFFLHIHIEGLKSLHTPVDRLIISYRYHLFNILIKQNLLQFQYSFFFRSNLALIIVILINLNQASAAQMGIFLTFAALN